MNSSIIVKAPATVANMGCGYDTIGFALEGIYEEIEVSKREDSKLVIESIKGADLSLKATENVATIAVKSLLNELGIDQGFNFRIVKHFKPGSGLGSSASSAAGAVFGVNHLLSSPYSTADLLPFALEGEAFASKSYHADNVAPSLIGGCILIRSYHPLDFFSLPIAEELQILIVRPFAEIKTSEAKSILPKKIEVQTARNQWGNLASLVHAFHTKNWQRLNDSVQDFIAEPVRKVLIPGYDSVKEIALENESVGFNISGSGPSIFMLFQNTDSLNNAKKEILTLYENMSISCDSFITRMSNQGCQID